jgi:hypothetical protein
MRIALFALRNTLIQLIVCALLLVVVVVTFAFELRARALCVSAVASCSLANQFVLVANGSFGRKIEFDLGGAKFYRCRRTRRSVVSARTAKAPNSPSLIALMILSR